jgi:hypothetical protein
VKSFLLSILVGATAAVVAVYGARFILDIDISGSTAAIAGAVAGVASLTIMKRSEKSNG